MIWNRLKQMQCPGCNKPLIKSHNGKQNGYACSSKGYVCTFFVGTEKFNEIVSDLYKPKKAVVVEDNLSQLNNL